MIREVWIGLFLMVASCAFATGEKVFRLGSPDGKLEVAVSVGRQVTYTLTRDGRVLLDESAVGLVLGGTENKIFGHDSRFIRKKMRSGTEKIISPFYRCPSFTVEYNEMSLSFKESFTLVFRSYNEGVAYRFVTAVRDSLTIQDEVAEFNFDRDYKTCLAWSTAAEGKDPYAMAFQNVYEKQTLTGLDTGKVAFLPFVVDYGDGVKLTVTEADLEGYPGMHIKAGGQKKQLKGVFAGYPAQMAYHPWRHMTYVAERSNYIARTEGTKSFPWRVLAVSSKDTEMPVNNLVYALASSNRIGDYSWVKTGKVAWDWWNDWGISGVDFKAGINTQTYKYYIDFASENGIPFIVLDEGWYDPYKGDMMTVVPDVDLPELVRYGKEKQVDLILWTVFNVLDEQLEAACWKYAEMGISGFKVDFLDRDDQTAVEMVYRIAEACARHKLSLDLHGIYKPTGLNRTYPNVINFESVFGMEEMKWSTVEKDMMQYDVEMPYIRMMAGPVDYTPGAMRNASKKDFKDIYYNPMSQGTRCHQLAAYVVHDSPLTMLADNPTVYRKEQECTDFIVKIPNTGFDETRILQGEMGTYIVTARRLGDDWFLGGMTNWDARDVCLDFSYLGEGNYKAVLFKDGVNAEKQATDYKKEELTVTGQSRLKIRMAPGGGFVISITKK